MIIRKSKTVLLGIVAAGLTTWQPALAGFSQGDSVTLGGQAIFRMADSGGMTGVHRAWLAQDALDNALVAASDRSPAAISVGRENGAITVSLDGRKFATADANSASLAGTTAGALAENWAQSVRDFLSDQSRTTTYLETLKSENRISANIALRERTFYAPAGMQFPISLRTGISTSTCKVGDAVEGTIDNDVLLGNYVIPAGTTVLGEVCLARSGQPDSFTIRFNELRTANGTVVPIDAICLDGASVSAVGPHRVCTYRIPSGMANGVPQVAGRIPAGIGVGALDTDGTNVLVFDKTAGELAAGSLMSVQFAAVSRVAVVMRQSM
jgi:hypothetical protein